MEIEKAEYILNYFRKFMNAEEKAAWKHWSTTYKTQNSGLSEKELESRQRIFLKAGWLTQDSEVLELLNDGIDSFKISTAERISKDHPEVLVMNNCPKCGKPARTPFAKQCRFCDYDWH